jgi:hypothetical protein
MKTLFYLLTLSLILLGCSKDEDNTPTPQAIPPDTASYFISSEETVTALHQSDSIFLVPMFPSTDTISYVAHGLTSVDSANLYHSDNIIDSSSMFSNTVQTFPLLTIRRVLAMYKV